MRGRDNCRGAVLEEEEENGDAEQREDAREAQRLSGHRGRGHQLHKQAHGNAASHADEQLEELIERGVAAYDVAGLACGVRAVVGAAEDRLNDAESEWCGLRNALAHGGPFAAPDAHRLVDRGGQRREDDHKDEHRGDQVVIRNAGVGSREAKLRSNGVAYREGQVRSEGGECVGRGHGSESRPLLAMLEEVNLAASDRRLVDLHSLRRQVPLSDSTLEEVPRLAVGLMLVLREVDGVEGALRKNWGRTTRHQRGNCAYFDGALFGARAVDVVRALGATGGALHVRRGVVECEMTELSSTWATHSDGTNGGWEERAALVGAKLIKPQVVYMTKSPSGDKSLGSVRAALGATAALVVLFDSVAELSHLRLWRRRPSIADAGRTAINELGDWIGRASRRHRNAFVTVAMRERERIVRGVEAASDPAMVSRLDCLSVANALRAEVAAFRNAAWPPSDVIAPTARLSGDYLAQAVAAGVRAGLLHAESPAVSLAAVRSLSSTRPCAAALASDTSASETATLASTQSSDSSRTSSDARTSICERSVHGDLHAMTALFAFGGVVACGWPCDPTASQKRPREWVGLSTL